MRSMPGCSRHRPSASAERSAQKKNPCSADVVFLSPPWGGPEYQHAAEFDVSTMMGGLDGAEILRQALRIAPSVCYFLPKNTSEAQLEALAADAGVRLELERCSLNGRTKGIVAYFGFEEEEE